MQDMEIPNTHSPKTISGMLMSSLDMEDEIAHSVYQDYLDRKNWPVELRDETFEEIRKHLATLLKDTQRHRNIIKHLQAKLSHVEDRE
jgi:hypothetical protein